MGGATGALSTAWSQTATDAQDPNTGAATPVETPEQAEAEESAEAEEPLPAEALTADEPLSTPTEGSLTNETVDAKGNTVNTIESHQDKTLRRRVAYVLNPSGQVLERMTEVFTKTGELQSIQQTRFDEEGTKIFDAQYQFTDGNISKAHINEWNPDKTTTSLTFNQEGFPIEQTITYPDGSVKTFDAIQSETDAKALLQYQFPEFDLATIRLGSSRFLTAEDLGDGTFYPGGFIGLHFVTFQVGENGPTLSYIGGLDPLTGSPVVLATRTTTDYLVDFYSGI